MLIPLFANACAIVLQPGEGQVHDVVSMRNRPGAPSSVGCLSRRICLYAGEGFKVARLKKRISRIKRPYLASFAGVVSFLV